MITETKELEKIKFDSEVEDIIHMLGRIEKEFKLQCYQREIDDPDDIRICFWDNLEKKRINIQFWQMGNKGIYYLYIVGIFKTKNGRITDGFDLKTDIINGIDEQTLYHIVSFLFSKIAEQNVNEENRIHKKRNSCEVTIPFFYQPFDSIGTKTAAWIEIYAKIFARRWNTYLSDDTEMRAKIHISPSADMLALEFFPADKDDKWNLKPKDDSWDYILQQISNTLPQYMGTSQIILDGIVHAVSDDSIIIIKRNEKRFWTRSLAREDAGATLCKRMVETRPEEMNNGKCQ